jgi:digeranylgeranylglycerophospholipid reductase
LQEVDVLIVGAGPAGSTTARYCAGRDVDVLMVDRRREIGYPVQCGEFLPNTKEMYDIFPRSLDLEELFQVDDSLIAGVVEAIDMISPGGTAYRCAFTGKTLDRRSFDKHLVNLATEKGARLLTETSFLGLKDGVVGTTAGDIRAKVIVGADGPNSRTARESGLRKPSVNYPAVTCQATGHFEPIIKMYFGPVAPGGYAWIIPKSHGANIGIGFNPDVLKDRPSALFHRFVERIGVNSYDEVTMGFVPTSGPVEQTVKGNVLLVGDSGGFPMATNGGGIPTAMIAARFAGQVIRKHLTEGTPLSEYQTRWRACMGPSLRNALRTRRMGDVVFPHEHLLGLTMFVLGRAGLSRAIRCKKVFGLF